MKDRIVLFVDDEVNILDSIRRGLIGESYKCLFATSGEKALAILEETNISVIVTDMRMPKMNGLELLKIVKEKYPNVVKIVLTGYTQLPQILATINQVDVFKFITKPWKLEEELMVVITQALEYYELKVESIRLKESLEASNEQYRHILETSNHNLRIISSDLINLKNINTTFLKSIKDIFKDENIGSKEQNVLEISNNYERIFDSYISKFQSMIKENE